VIQKRDRGVTKEAGDVLVAVDLLGETTLEGGVKNLVAVLLEQLVKSLDVAKPQSWSAMHELGQVRVGRLADRNEMFALQVALRALAGDGCDALRAVIGQRRARAGLGESVVHRQVASRDDADAIPEEVERAGDADRFGRHRVEAGFVRDEARGTDENGDP
jgi:hypothetical protein